MRLLKACQAFLKLAQRPGRDFSAITKYYEELKNKKLTPGPAGTKGQIFFIEGDSDHVVKFTTDKSEAVNMLKIKEIQDGKTEGFSEEEVESIKNNVIRVLDVFILTPKNSNSFYVIEQDKGIDVPFALASKLMVHIGPNISKQPDSVFSIISKKLSEPQVREELSKTLSESLLKGEEVGFTSTKADVGNLGLLLSTIRKKIDNSFRDFRPSNMVITKENDMLKLKLIDLGYGSPKPANIPEFKQ